MLKKCIASCVSILLAVFAHSQQNYLSGSIVKINGDTLRGYINYQNLEKNPLNVYFKKDMDLEADIFSPREIKSFSVGNEIYRTATVTLNNGFYKTEALEYSPDVSFRTETVFLQTLVRGSKSLYYFRDGEGREQFYVDVDSGFQLLIYHRYLKDLNKTQDINNSISIAEDKRFVGQLSYYLMDCPDLQSELPYLKYSKESLVKLFRQYYKCTDSKATFEKKSDETKAEFGVFAGLSITKVRFDAYEDYYTEIVNSDFPVSNNFAFGLFLNKKLSRNLGRLSVHNELFFSSYNTNAFYKDVVNENRYENNYISFGGFYIKINNMLQYTLPVNKISIMMRLGMSNGWNINETNEKTVESVFYNTHTEKTYPAIEDTHIYVLGLMGGVGVGYKHYSLDIRYEQNYGMSDMPTLNSSMRSLYFLVGYRF